MKIKELVRFREFRLLNEPFNDKEIKGCYISDLISFVMGKAKENNCWVTVMNHENIISVASFLGLSGIIITEGTMPDLKTIQKANECDIALISADCTTYEAVKILTRNDIA